ncbi:MAG TPA: FAD:protein FMN transferase [Candidatus Dormibacteraeota bacterium]|nr:FAD:protein FMN transferase [Candidatus Dormibacteraeota bacterium]
MAHAPQPVRRTAPVMGTVASIHVHDDAPLPVIDKAIGSTVAELERLEALFSTFRPTSQISEINAGTRTVTDCDDEVIAVLDACTWLEHESGGAFSAHPPDCPGRLDPSGFVKGWATEQAAACLTEAGLEHFYVAVGGDLLVHGSPAPARPWHIGLADPRRPGAAVGVIDILSGAVATSGTSERGGHIWDGRDGHAAGDFLAVTIVGPSLAWADAFATTAFALGADGPRWVTQFAGYAAVVVDRTGALHRYGPIALAAEG